MLIDFNCAIDCNTLKVYDGSTTSSVELLKASPNNTIPPSIVSTGHQLLVIFTTTRHGATSGFEADYAV